MRLEKFNHNCSWDLKVDSSNLSGMCCQNFDLFLVLDLEGKVEIFEFPVVMIDVKTMEVAHFFPQVQLALLLSSEIHVEVKLVLLLAFFFLPFPVVFHLILGLFYLNFLLFLLRTWIFYLLLWFYQIYWKRGRR